MFSWIETKYINLLGSQLDRFQKIGNAYNCRCKVCNDSQKSKTKARGWIFSTSTGARYFCHNCNASMTFKKFLKFVDSSLYYDLIKESYLETDKEKTDLQKFVDKMKKPEHVKTTGLKSLKKISQLASDHPAKLYVASRKIPPNMHHKLFYAPKFKTWVNEQIPNKFKDIKKDEPRLIIPLLNENKELIGFQGRSFKKNDPLKYITIMLKDEPKIFGMDEVNRNEQIYSFEGPIDAMFIPNSIASAGGRIDSNLEELGINDPILIYDNELRSEQTIKKIEKSIKLGYRVCIWPDSIQEKDINDMILSGMTIQEVKKIIDKNTYRGLQAELELITRKKI